MDNQNDTKKHISPEEIEKQLHEQYAINNNSAFSSVVAFIVAMFATFWGFGYVFFYSTNDFSSDGRFFNPNNELFFLDAVVVTGFATLIVLGIMYYICMYQGVAQRLEQFITFSIRYGCYQKTAKGQPNNCTKENIEQLMNDDYKRIFPVGYHPFDKGDIGTGDADMCNNCPLKNEQNECKRKGNIENIAQGLYGELMKLIRMLSIFVLICIIYRMVVNIINNCGCELSLYVVFELLFAIVAYSICLIILRRRKRKLLCSYYMRNQYYRSVLNI